MATAAVIDGVDKDVGVIPPPLKEDEGDGGENSKYLLVVSGWKSRRAPGFPCGAYARMLFEVMISDDYIMADDMSKVRLLNDFNFYAVEGDVSKKNLFGCSMLEGHSNHLGESNNGMAGFADDSGRQIIVMPDKKIILPYEAKPVFPFNEFRTSDANLEKICSDPELLLAAAADTVNNGGSIVLSKIPASKEGVPHQYADYKVDTRVVSIPVL